ncbi:DUF3237 family protein [Rugamonas sp.]|uniref:DUF3237 domain-containing protein n=1 Tax=Rugamonas sp. TaxID=1926287 RepID=UPI0025D0DFE0|nr:DUF3237 family protein [Rugamonas sp.]
MRATTITTDTATTADAAGAAQPLAQLQPLPLPTTPSMPRRAFLRAKALVAGAVALGYVLPGAATRALAAGSGAPAGLSPENLPAALTDLRLKPLLTMRLDVHPLQVIGATPGATRRVGVVPGGQFHGERLSGVILEGGNDWQSVRSDGSTTLDVRLVLKTDDGALIGVTYRGVRHGPADVIARLEKGEVVDPASYYFRIIPMFETAAPRYDWLNRIVAVGSGQRRADGVVYNLFEVL